MSLSKSQGWSDLPSIWGQHIDEPHLVGDAAGRLRAGRAGLGKGCLDETVPALLDRPSRLTGSLLGMNFPIINLLNVANLVERLSFDCLHRSDTGVGGREGLELQQHDVDKI